MLQKKKNIQCHSASVHTTHSPIFSPKRNKHHAFRGARCEFITSDDVFILFIANIIRVHYFYKRRLTLFNPPPFISSARGSRKMKYKTIYSPRNVKRILKMFWKCNHGDYGAYGGSNRIIFPFHLFLTIVSE